MPVFPVTWTAPGSIPSRRRLSRASFVGAKWIEARWLAATRLASSGNGESSR